MNKAVEKFSGFIFQEIRVMEALHLLALTF